MFKTTIIKLLSRLNSKLFDSLFGKKNTYLVFSGRNMNITVKYAKNKHIHIIIYIFS